MAAEKFKKKVAVCSYEEAISANNSIYCKMVIVSEEGTQYIAYYFGYAKTDKKYFDDPEHVYEMIGNLAADGTVKITNIDLTQDKASDIIKSKIDVDQEKLKLMESLKALLTKAKYTKLIRSVLLEHIDAVSGASMFNFPFLPHSLIKHINN